MIRCLVLSKSVKQSMMSSCSPKKDQKQEARFNTSGASSRSSRLCSNDTDASFIGVTPNFLADMPSMEVSTSVVLGFCRKKVIKHYFRLAALVGWKPIIRLPSSEECYPCVETLNFVYNLLVLMLLVFGHVLQYASCFRRDGLYPLKDSNSTLLTMNEPMDDCKGSVFAVYFLPALLQLVSYFTVLLHMRSPESEQLQALMEKVFLQMTMTNVWHLAKKRITQGLRGVHIAGMTWLFVSVAAQILNIVTNEELSFCWIYDSGKREVVHVLLVCFLVLTLLWHDLVSMAIATTYGIHCQLVLVYLQNMSQAMRERTLSFNSFYKGVEEARNSIRYINKKQALGVTLQMMWLCTRTAVCTYALLVTPWENPLRFLSSTLSVFLWVTLALIPLVQACRLSSTCNHIRELGHELRTRPFGYNDVSQTELDSMVLFTSSLRLQARLCALPVTKRSVYSSCLLISFCLFVLIQLDVLHFGP